MIVMQIITSRTDKVRTIYNALLSCANIGNWFVMTLRNPHNVNFIRFYKFIVALSTQKVLTLLILFFKLFFENK
jgi:hypothetical protein